jgi:hypothetical protein
MIKAVKKAMGAKSRCKNPTQQQIRDIFQRKTIFRQTSSDRSLKEIILKKLTGSQKALSDMEDQ